MKSKQDEIFAFFNFLDYILDNFMLLYYRPSVNGIKE